MHSQTQQKNRSIASRLPVLSILNELDSGPRRFLMFNFFNVISWQCVAGQVLVLFARHIDMPTSRVGFLISFLPLSAMLVAFTVPLVTRLGPKRLLFATWLMRNMVACSVFIMPWAIERWGMRAGWYVLMGATLGFCLMRAMGNGSWFPWLHEVIPERERALFFSAQSIVIQLTSVVIMLGVGFLLHDNPSLNRFLAVYGIGIAAGFTSLGWVLRVPGGKAVPPMDPARRGLASYRMALHDRPFVLFVLTSILCFSAVSWIEASIILYMRDALAIPAMRIMLRIAAGSLGILLTIHFWARFADHSGSGRTMCKALIGHAAAAALCLTLVPGRAWTPHVLWAAVVLFFVFRAAFDMATHRAMLGYVREAGRIGYTNIYMVSFSFAKGVTPIAAGFIIHSGGLWGFRACFIIACAFGLAGAVLSRAVLEDSPAIAGPLTRLINPVVPLRTLARIVWITVGMHESNRDAKEGAKP